MEDTTNPEEGRQHKNVWSTVRQFVNRTSRIENALKVEYCKKIRVDVINTKNQDLIVCIMQF